MKGEDENMSLKQRIAAGAFSLALVLFVSPLVKAGEEAKDNFSGRLFRALAGDTLEKEYNIGVLGWAEGTAIYNNNGSKNVSPQGFFNTDEGFNLNQFGLMACRGDGCPPFQFGPKHNVVSRIGPFPGPRGEDFDIGFNVTAIYGEDNQFLRTLGFDDFDFDDSDEEKFAIPQLFVDMYFPVLDGTTLMLGSFQTSLENEIGYPFSPPDWFATHTYAFQHGPAKHVGALLQTKIPTPDAFGLLSLEFGSVLGWNDLDNDNEDLDWIAALRWRSPDMRTWIDIEGIFGNGENDFAAEGPANGGSPYLVLSSTGEYLDRFAGYLVASHAFSDRFQAAIEATYGYQEAGDLAPAPVFITRDADWYGININGRYQLSPTISLNGRAEWFNDDEGAHVLWAGSPGGVYAFTANLTWQPFDFVRIRPEIRYDIYEGDGAPLFGDKDADEQFLGLLNVVLQY
jgi:hypothetical protein